MAYNFLCVFLSLVLVHQLRVLVAGGLVAQSGTDGGKGQEKGEVELHDDIWVWYGILYRSRCRVKMVSGPLNVRTGGLYITVF